MTMTGSDSSRTRPRSGTYVALALLLLVTAACGATTASVLILPLGDSITHGGNGDGGVLYPTYRAWLYQDLRKLGHDVDFVGSLDQPLAPAGSDPDNEGHAAYTTGQVLDELPMWLVAYPPPDVALVHLGTNDAIRGIPAGRSAADLQGVIGVLRARNPSMAILIAQIIPTSVASTNTRIEALNREIAGLSALSTPQSPVVVVDMYSEYDGQADNQQGGVHPLTSGEQKMAADWEIALVPLLDRGTQVTVVTTAPTTRPAAVVTAAPAADPVVTTTVPAGPTVTVTATPVSRFGARSYRIGNVPTRTLSGGSGSSLTVAKASRARITASDASTSLRPPSATSFVRWYPATRWSTGLR